MQPFGLNKNPRCIYSRATARENNIVESVDVGRALRGHIDLDCHSRTPTFPTLIVLLRNDRVGRKYELTWIISGKRQRFQR